MSANIVNAARRLTKHIHQQFGDFDKSPTAKLARDLDIAISAEIKTPDFRFVGTPQQVEIENLKSAVNFVAAVECSHCDEAKTESHDAGCLTSIRSDVARTVWKYGWIVIDGKVLCPNCREEGS